MVSAFWKYLRGLIGKERCNIMFLLASGLALSLEFKMAAEILKTVLVRELEELIVLGAVIGVAVFCRIKKIRMTTLLDLVLLGFLIGQMIGRWGNFMNREAFGAETISFLRMGLFNTKTGAWEYYHPTFLYESLWNAAGFVLLHFLSKKRRYDGQIALGYVAWYGLGRALIEGLRMDSLYWGPFRVSQVLAAVSCVAAVSVLLYQSFRTHDPKNLLVNQVAEKETVKVESAEAETVEEESVEEVTVEAAEEE